MSRGRIRPDGVRGREGAEVALGLVLADTGLWAASWAGPGEPGPPGSWLCLWPIVLPDVASRLQICAARIAVPWFGRRRSRSARVKQCLPTSRTKRSVARSRNGIRALTSALMLYVVKPSTQPEG